LYFSKKLLSSLLAVESLLPGLSTSSEKKFSGFFPSFSPPVFVEGCLFGSGSFPRVCLSSSGSLEGLEGVCVVVSVFSVESVESTLEERVM